MRALAKRRVCPPALRHRQLHHHLDGRPGLYIGKIFSQVNERPLFIVEEEIGGGDADEHTIATLELPIPNVWGGPPAR